MKFDSPETEEVEYIKAVGKFEKAAISLSAMLNAHGHGVVYLGVKKDGTIVGRDISEEDAQSAASAVEGFLKPAIEVKSSISSEDETSYLKLEASGANRPYSSGDKYFIRYGAEDRIMSGEQIKSLALCSASDLLVSMPSKRQNLDFTRLKALCKSSLSRDERLDDIAPLQTADGRCNMLAYMLSDDNDLFVRVRRRDAFGESDFECGGECMLSAMGKVEEYIKSLYQETAAFQGKPLFDVAAFEAAWRNAFLHDAWETCAAPEIDVYDDRMEIVSYGGLVEGMSERDFFSGKKNPANCDLEVAMEKLGFAAKDSHKTSTVTKAYGEGAFLISDVRVVVTVPFAYALKEKSERSEVSNERVPLRDKIVALIEENPYITAEQMSVRCKVSKSTISNAMSGMTRDGIVAREGSRKTGKWKIL